MTNRTSDLVAKLREMDAHDTPAHANVLMQEAADEIERLRTNPHCPHGLTPKACQESACDRPKPRLVEVVRKAYSDPKGGPEYDAP